MNCHFKTGQLVTYDEHPLYVGNIIAIFTYIIKIGALYFLKPEQTASSIDTPITEWLGYSRIPVSLSLGEDRLVFKAGTPDPSYDNPRRNEAAMGAHQGGALLSDGSPKMIKRDFLGHQAKMNRHDPILSKLLESESIDQDGGKIVEKANAVGNASDTK